jgi:hypothetical protein
MAVVARLSKDGVLISRLFDEINANNNELGVNNVGVFVSDFIDENIISNLPSNVPMRITQNKELLVYDYIDEINQPETYQILNETQLPIYGTGGGLYPPNPQWDGLLNQSRDDFFIEIGLPFTFYIAGTGYTSTFLGSNAYLTFGSGSLEYISLSPSNPPFPKFHFGSADNSFQRVSTFNYSNEYTRIRYEGTASTSGIIGSPNIVLEITLFNPISLGDKNILELRVGNHARPMGQKMVANSTTAYATYAHETNQSYVFVGNSDGTQWNILTGYYVDYTVS